MKKNKILNQYIGKLVKEEIEKTNSIPSDSVIKNILTEFNATYETKIKQTDLITIDPKKNIYKYVFKDDILNIKLINLFVKELYIIITFDQPTTYIGYRVSFKLMMKTHDNNITEDLGFIRFENNDIFNYLYK